MADADLAAQIKTALADVEIPGGGDLLLPAKGFNLGGQLHRFATAGGLLHLIIQHIGGLEGQGQQA